MKHRIVAVQVFFPVGVSNLEVVQCGGYTLKTETNSNYNNFIKIIMIQCETPVIIKPGHFFTCVCVCVCVREKTCFSYHEFRSLHICSRDCFFQSYFIIFYLKLLIIFKVLVHNNIILVLRSS
jgi:hypothetical protein